MRAPSASSITAREIVALCFDPSERAKWLVMRTFPALAPWSCFDDLTDEEELWITVQKAIDDGLRLCPSCGAHGYGAFCGSCGAEYGTARECGRCHALGAGAYCTSCGERLSTAESLTRDLLAGRRTYEELDELTREGCSPGESDSYRLWLEAAVGAFDE